jgi:thioesterase domain-containing protein/acyl-coenzyme A synthetase/AMP-(fatty) acid ligase
VILADVNGDPTYAQLLRRVSEWSTESYAHQDLPFSRLMEEFQLDQAGATSQFLQVYFVYQKAFMQPQEAPGLKVTPRPSVSGGVNFDLLVSIVERAEGPRLQMEYNTVIFRKERILAMIEMYIRVLEAVMDDDSLTVSRIPLVSSTSESVPADSAERLQTSDGHLKSAPLALPGLLSLAQWLDNRAQALADTTAIVSGDMSERFSWSQLRQRSLDMASALRNRGISTGQTVALRLEYSVDTAAAAWALLRIGAVALPLPTSSSAEEWTQLLAAYKPALALASRAFTITLPELISYEDLVMADANRAQTCGDDEYPQSTAPAWLGIVPDEQLTIVPATHQATLEQILGAARVLDLRIGDLVLTYPAESAADAWIDLLLPLAAGAILVYPGDAAPAAMQSLLDRHQVSFVFTSPKGLLAAVHDRWAGDRRLNIVARDGLMNNAQTKRLSATPMRLWTMLSSALTAGPLAIAKVAGESRPGFAPLPGQRLVILDDNNLPVPSGVSGVLALQREAGTHRTGYLARTAPHHGLDGIDGENIEILDLSSRLLRLHGYRLRLGELEEFLWQSTAVADVVAAIVPVNDAPTLVAYFQPYAPAANNARVTRDHFQSVAPGHVVGAELIPVNAIPRRACGSADLARLPAPGSAKQTNTPTDEYLPPRDELESSLVAVWEDVLNVRPIGVRTSFFKLGGYSLMIVRLFARINKVLNTSLPITTIFNAPTVEQLADIVRGRAYYSALVPVQTKGTRPPFFMVHSYLLYQGIPTELGEDYPFYGLRELDTDAKDMTVEQRAAACLDEMRSIQPNGPYYIGGWCAAGPLAVETARQIVATGETVGFLVLFDSWRPGYAAELARNQAGLPEMTLRATLYRKYLFHRNRWNTLSFKQRVRYVTLAFSNKFSSLRSKLYLKNWAFAEWFCKRFGLPLPHFMHNVSLTTLNSLKEYRGVEPYPGSLTLIRAKEAPYIPGAQEHCGWEPIVLGGVKVLWAPGDHESMFLPPNLHTVGEFLRQSLAEAYAQQQR